MWWYLEYFVDIGNYITLMYLQSSSDHPILLYFDVCHNPLPYVVFWHQLPCSMDYILAFSLDWCFIIFHAHWFCLGLWILWFDIWYVSLILFYRASWISSWFDLWVMFCCCLSSSFALWLIVAAIFSFLFF